MLRFTTFWTQWSYLNANLKENTIKSFSPIVVHLYVLSVVPVCRETKHNIDQKKTKHIEQLLQQNAKNNHWNTTQKNSHKITTPKLMIRKQSRDTQSKILKEIKTTTKIVERRK